MLAKGDKTKKLLKDTLVKLMSETDFDKINVKDLTDKLDINRGTFYLHFKDKYDLLEQMELDILCDFNKIMNNVLCELNTSTILPSDRKALLYLFTKVYTYIRENAIFMKTVLASNGDLNFQMKLKKYIENPLVTIISFTNDSDNFPIEYIATIASSSQLGIIQKWLKSGMVETPEELAEFVSNVIFTIYTGVIKKLPD